MAKLLRTKIEVQPFSHPDQESFSVHDSLLGSDLDDGQAKTRPLSLSPIMTVWSARYLHDSDALLFVHGSVLPRTIWVRRSSVQHEYDPSMIRTLEPDLAVACPTCSVNIPTATRNPRGPSGERSPILAARTTQAAVETSLDARGCSQTRLQRTLLSSIYT